MDDLSLKRQRSVDRCRLLSRVPVYDYAGQTLFYELKFTAGNILKTNALQERHIWHIIQGYFHRRSMVNFVGPGVSAMVGFPISPKLEEYMQFFPVGKLIVRIHKTEPPTISSMHLVSHLGHYNMRFAIDLGTLLSTDWIKCIKSFQFVLIRMDEDFKEKLLLASQLRAEAPWIKFIVTRVKDRAGFKEAFDSGADYVKTSYFDFKDLAALENSKNMDPALRQEYDELLGLLHAMKNNHHDSTARLQKMLTAFPDVVRDIIKLMVFFHKDINFASVNSYNAACTCLGKEVVNSYLGIAVLRNLTVCFGNATNTKSSGLQLEPFKKALIRAKFFTLLAKVKGSYDLDQNPFLDGVFSNLEIFLIKSKDSAINDALLKDLMRACSTYESIAAKMYRLVKAIETLDFRTVVEAAQQLDIKTGRVLSCYEKALIWMNRLFEKLY